MLLLHPSSLLPLPWPITSASTILVGLPLLCTVVTLLCLLILIIHCICQPIICHGLILLPGRCQYDGCTHCIKQMVLVGFVLGGPPLKLTDYFLPQTSLLELDHVYICYCRKLPRYVPYKCTYVPYNATFGVSNQSSDARCVRWHPANVNPGVAMTLLCREITTSALHEILNM